jgi:hypothetical protein
MNIHINGIQSDLEGAGSVFESSRIKKNGTIR